MNKQVKLALLALIGAVGGASLAIFRSPERQVAAAQEVFPPEKMKGHVENPVIQMVDKGTGGGPVIARVIVPYGVAPEQVSPTGYVALKALKAQFPDAERIAAFLAEDSAMARASNWVGLAQYVRGQVTVTGGLPTQLQLDSLAKAGQALRRPTPEDLRLVADVFDSTSGLYLHRWNIARGLVGAAGQIDRSRFADVPLSTPVVHKAAKRRGLKTQEAKDRVLDVVRYYWLRAGELL